MLELALKLLLAVYGRKRLMKSYMSTIHRVDKTPSDVRPVLCEEAIVGVIIVLCAAATAAVRM